MEITARVEGTGSDYVVVTNSDTNDFTVTLSVNGGTEVTLNGLELSTAIAKCLTITT